MLMPFFLLGAINSVVDGAALLQARGPARVDSTMISGD